LFRDAAHHPVARRSGLTEIFRQLAEGFPRVRSALNKLSDRLVNLDDDSVAAPGLALLS